tara:strand:- start:331 stop:774 length:444 start_codon:yes stop_codon:yes gene_type:complete
MVAKLEPKTVGTSGACTVCGSNVIWVEKTWQGKASLTLRNSSDQKAHNVKSGDSWICSTGNEFSGNTQSVASKATENTVVWESMGKLTPDQKQLKDGLSALRSIAYDFTKECHPELSENSNSFGQINNANMTHLLALMSIKAIKDSK